MRRGVFLTVTMLVLALSSVSALTETSYITGQDTLFRPVKALAEDSHVEGMEAMKIGPAYPPKGAPSHGFIIGDTFPGDTVLGGGLLCRKRPGGLQRRSVDSASGRSYRRLCRWGRLPDRSTEDSDFTDSGRNHYEYTGGNRGRGLLSRQISGATPENSYRRYQQYDSLGHRRRVL